MNVSQFYFAWVSSGETSFDGSHMREDELIFSFKLKQEEGQVAELELEIINPHIGLLAPGRPLWCWFSWSDGSNVYPLFFGRLVSIPDDLFADIITVNFVAKPMDYTEQLFALAESMKVLPFYDPIFVSDKKQSDPNTVLEGYSKLWHVDRITHDVTASDIIAGEDGVIEFAPEDVFYDGVKVKIAGPPMMVCEINAEVTWVQCDHTGKFEFKTVSGVKGKTDLGAGLNATKGVEDPGLAVAGQAGLIIKEPNQQTITTSDFKNDSPGPHTDGELMEEHESMSFPFYGGVITQSKEVKIDANSETGQGGEYSLNESYDYLLGFEIHGAQPGTIPKPPEAPLDTKTPDLNNDMQIATEVEQDRTEVLHARVFADVQPVFVEPATTTDSHIKQTLTMNASDLVALGVLTASDGTYFPTARGLQSLEYILMVARANLLAGSRVIEISWDCKFPVAVYSGISCRKNAVIIDGRLPGDFVIGKITGYSLTGDGDNGEFVANVTVNCAVGNGNAVTEVTGVPVYVDEGYVDVGYQHYDGKFVLAVTNDMVFQPLAFEPSGIQIPISQDQVLIRHEFHNGGAADIVRSLYLTAQAQLNALQLAMQQATNRGIVLGPSAATLEYVAAQTRLNVAIDKAIADHPSWVELELAPVQNISTNVEFDADVEPLVIPKQIDLAAPSSS